MVLSLTACGKAEDKASASAENETTSASVAAENTDYSVDTQSVTVTDTNGNEIKSGSATVSFEGKTKTISAAYLIDGVDVEITSGAYSSASESSDEVVFLVVNGGSLKITGTAQTYVGISKTGSGASGGQVNDDYNFYGINSGIVAAGENTSVVIEYASITTSANGSNAVVSTCGAEVSISSSVITSTGESGS